MLGKDNWRRQQTKLRHKRRKEQEPTDYKVDIQGRKKNEERPMGKEKEQSRKHRPHFLEFNIKRLTQYQEQGCRHQPTTSVFSSQAPPSLPMEVRKQGCAMSRGCSAGQAKLLCNGRHFFISSKSKPDTA